MNAAASVGAVSGTKRDRSISKSPTKPRPSRKALKKPPPVKDGLRWCPDCEDHHLRPRGRCQRKPKMKNDLWAAFVLTKRQLKRAGAAGADAAMRSDARAEASTAVQDMLINKGDGLHELIRLVWW